MTRSPEQTSANPPSARCSGRRRHRWGGVGRFSGGGACDPEGAAFTACGTVSLTLPATAPVLLIASVVAKPEGDADRAVGDCQLRTSSTATVPGSNTTIAMENSGSVQFHQGASMTAVTELISAGLETFAVDCNQEPTIGAIQYEDVAISAVALSPE